MATATSHLKATAEAGKSKKSASAAGRFGVYGGRYVPETLMAALQELEQEESMKKPNAIQNSKSASNCC